MAARPNCWEVMRCGREPGGAMVEELGECPAAVAEVGDGVNGGRCCGRICWALTGTFCGGKVQGTYAEKHLTCLSCEFFAQVKREQGLGFEFTLPVLKAIP